MKRNAITIISVLTVCVVQASNGPVKLENEAMSIGFSPRGSGYAVTEIVNKLGGVTRFVETDRRAPDFWEIWLVRADGKGSKEIRLQNHTPSKERKVERIKDGLAFTWKGMSIPGGEKECVDVRAEVLLPKGSTASEWRISVDCRSRRWALKETRCPVLRGIVKSCEADVLVPHKAFGARLIKACDTDKEPVGTFGYPGWYPMVAAYMKDGAGLYLAAQDPEACNKSVVFGKGAEIAFVTPVENAGMPGKVAKGPRYPVRVEVFRGDWWKAAHIYREWAVKQKWCAKGKLADRKDYPKRMAEVDLFLRPGGDPSSVSNLVSHARKALPGFNLITHWYVWNVQPFDTHYPEYFPKKGAPETFAWMNSINAYSMPYINGRLWDMSLASARYAVEDACMRPDGKPWIENYARAFAVMCPKAKRWQQALLHNFTNVVYGWGAGAVYCDQISCSRPHMCHNPAHGHTLGGGNWWAEGYREALEPVRKALAPAGAPITSEGMAECWIDCIDGHLMCTDPVEGDVPFYPAVYSGYTTYFGARMHQFDSPEAFHAIQMRSLVWGTVAGWMHPWMFVGRHRNDLKIASLLAAGRVRRDAREFLAYGTLEDKLRPLEPLPEVKFSWDRRDRRKRDVQHRFEVSFPSVIGSVWKNASGGRSAVIAANVASGAQTVKFALPHGAKELSALSVEGVAAPRFSVSGGTVTLELPPRGIAVLASP